MSTGVSHYLCSRITIVKSMDITFIITVALAAFIVVVIGLVLSLLYYKWRLSESHRTLARFIRENVLLWEKQQEYNSTT